MSARHERQRIARENGYGNRSGLKAVSTCSRPKVGFSEGMRRLELLQQTIDTEKRQERGELCILRNLSEKSVQPETIDPVKATLSLFNPETPVHETDTVKRFFGPYSLALSRVVSSDREVSDEGRKRLYRRVDREFYQNVQNEFGLKSEQEAQDFHERQREHANATIDYVNNTLYPDNGRVVQINDSRLPLTPHRVVELYAGNTDQRLKFEVQRQLGLELVTGQLDMQERKSFADKKLSQIQEILENEKDGIYGGKTGETQNVRIKVQVDRTNNVLSVDGKNNLGIRRNRFAQLGLRVLHRQEEMRPLRDGGLVLTNPDKKSIPAQVVKTFKKAEKRANAGLGDEIKTSQDVLDVHRMLFVVHGDQNQVDQLKDKVQKLLEEKEHELYEYDANGNLLRDKFGDPIGKVVPVKDDETNKDGTQSEYVQFRRLQVILAGDELPIELKFETYQQYMLDQLHVGQFDKKKSEFTGASHEFYEICRIEQGIEKSIHPVAIFSREEGDLEKERLQTWKRTARRLLNTK
jgi:hypothetical protein